jgi:hypothetical protein
MGIGNSDVVIASTGGIWRAGEAGLRVSNPTKKGFHRDLGRVGRWDVALPLAWLSRYCVG